MHILLLQVNATGPPTSLKAQCTASDSALAALPDLTALVNEVIVVNAIFIVCCILFALQRLANVPDPYCIQSVSSDSAGLSSCLLLLLFSEHVICHKFCIAEYVR